MATPEEIKIRIIAADEASKVFEKTRGSTDRLKSSVTKLKVALAGISITGGLFLKSVIDTGAQVQALRVRLRFLTGSVESGAKAFQIMSKYASSVPFALEEIQQGSAQLLTVANGVDELNGLLQITGDLAAVSGLSFVEASSQIQRAFAGGIASAELFRERGISAMLGFQAGVSYTGEETRKIIVDAFANGTTSVRGATKELAKTFNGQVSMMQDAWFNLKVSLADTGLVDEATKQIKNLTEILKDPEVIDGVKTFTKALLELFQFITRNAQVLIAVGAVWLGGQAGAAVGDIFGRKGKAIGAITGGLTSLLAALHLLDEETKKTLTDMTVYVDEGEQNMSDSLKKMQGNVKATSKEMEELKKKFELAKITLADVAAEGIKTFEDSLVSMIEGTKSAKEAFSDMAKSIISDLIRMQVRANITAPLSNMISGFFAPSVSGTQATPATEGSFAGGGYTGIGSRSGGVDGKGGFPAILHPNETVIDHEAGQSMGGSPINVTLNISTGVAQTVRTEIQSMLPMITNATKAAIVDAKQRGGSFARAMA